MENKVKDLLDICGDFYIQITDFNKVNPDGKEIIYWQGWTDDYYNERPYGDYVIKHVSSNGTISKEINHPNGVTTIEFTVLVIMIDIEQSEV